MGCRGGYTKISSTKWNLFTRYRKVLWLNNVYDRETDLIVKKKIRAVEDESEDLVYIEKLKKHLREDLGDPSARNEEDPRPSFFR